MADEMSRAIANLGVLADAVRAEDAVPDAGGGADAVPDAADTRREQEIERLRRRVAALESGTAFPHGRGGFPWCGGEYSGDWRGRFHGMPKPNLRTYAMRPHGRGVLEFTGLGRHYVRHTEDGHFVNGHFRRGTMVYPDGTREPFPFPRVCGQWIRRTVQGQGQGVGQWRLVAIRQAGWVAVTCELHRTFRLVVTPTGRAYCTHDGWQTWDWCYRGPMSHIMCRTWPEVRVAL